MGNDQEVYIWIQTGKFCTMQQQGDKEGEKNINDSVHFTFFNVVQLRAHHADLGVSSSSSSSSDARSRPIIS